MVDPRVCFVMKRYLTTFFEGYTISSRNLIKAAKVAGIDAAVFSAEPWSFRGRESSTYVSPTIFAEKYHIDDVLTTSYAFFLSSLQDHGIIHFLPNVAGDIYSLIVRAKPRKRAKTIAHFAHPYGPFIPSPFSRFRLSFLFKKLLDYIFCSTNFLVNYFRQNTGIPESRIFRVPLPVDTDRYKPLPQKEKLREKHGVSGEHVVAFVGQIEPVRGVFDLLRGFHKIVKSIDNVQLVISNPSLAFEGPYEFAFQNMVRDLKLEDKVVLLGPQPHLEEVYNLADMVVFPYTQPYFYFDPPMTLFEAMSSGALVIASDVGAVSDLVSNGENGLLIRPRSIEMLTDSVIDCLKNSDNYSSLKSRARETIVDGYSMRRIGAILSELYSEILDN